MFLRPYFSTGLLIIIICSAFFCTNVHAQLTKEITFSLPENKVANSLYNKIALADIRPDTTNMGIVRIGFFDKKAKVITKQPLSTQFNNIMSALIDNSAGKQELLLVLRQINFIEVAMSNKGFFQLRAAMFVKKDGGYQKLNDIDTVKMLYSGIDVTNALLSYGSKSIANYIAKNLQKESVSSTNYTYNDILNIDSVEKSKLPVYSAVTYIDGLYTTFKSFCEQKPDAEINVDHNAIQNNLVTTPDKTGKFKKVKSGSIYAIASKGQLYAATKFGYYPINKVNGEFIFTGQVSTPGNAMGGFGAVGGLLAVNQNGTFEIMIDHLTGGFVKLKEIVTPPPSITETSY